MQDVIKKKVDEIVALLDSGREPEDFAYAAKDDPYVFIIEPHGRLLVHPTLVGQNLKVKAKAVFDLFDQGPSDGEYVRYLWGGGNKFTYFRKTKNGLIVGCGYNE